MNILSNLRIGTRLAGGFGLVLLLLLGLVALATQALYESEEAGDRLIDQEWTQAEAMSELDEASRGNALATAELFFARTPAYYPCAHTRARLDDEGAAYDVIDAGHDAPLTHPDLVAQLLLEQA